MRGRGTRRRITKMTPIMDTDRNWIVVRIDGKLAGISKDYGRLAEISARITPESRHQDTLKRRKSARQQGGLPYGEISAKAVTFEEVLALRESAVWDDFILFGTDFQKRVWKTLWELTHPDSSPSDPAGHDPHIARLVSYSDFAGLCENRAGVRAVAHAVGLNPLPVVIPCHLVVPKEAIDKIREIQRKAETTLFRGEDLCRTSILRDQTIDFGDYALGRALKRSLISNDIAE